MAEKLNPEAIEFFRKHGARGGKIGGKVRTQNLTPEERSEIARKGGKARWPSKNGTKPAAQSGTPVKSVQPKRKRKV